MKPDNYPADPAHLWQHFYEITRIPRPSRREDAVRGYIIGQAESLGYDWRTDDEGNLLVSVPPSEGQEAREPVIIQNHLDMVTVKAAHKAHDFNRDPLSLRVEEGWLRADDTTLGADNGVGCAAALALMTDPGVVRPPLALLFTVDEETGLGGALRLDASLLVGSRMLNLDTEEWRELYVGCAGGGGWQFHRDFDTGAVPPGHDLWTLSLGGLAGGHSGIQIHEQLGNAIKLLVQCLQDLPGLQLGSLDAGVAHNVIPREGSIGFACPAEYADELASRLEAVRRQSLEYLPPEDGNLALALHAGDFEEALSVADSRQVLDVLAAFPHGVQAYNLDVDDALVDLSINLAMTRLQEGRFMLESSYRFFNTHQSVPLQQSVLALARAFDLEVVPVEGYPGWQPDMHSPLLERGRTVYEALFGEQPAVKAIHAGLECGILKGKKPALDILSFGPTIRGAHSPSERLHIETVKPFWRFLCELLIQI